MRALVVLVALATAANADKPSADKPRSAQAKRVYAGVYLHDVSKLDQKDGLFNVDLEVWAKWLGELEAERLVLANAAGDISRVLVAEESDGDWHSARWRVRGTLRGEFPLGRFPFDAQTLGITLELPRSDGELVPDLASSGVRNRFSITGWLYTPHFRPRIADETFRSDMGSLANEGRATTVGRVRFEVTLHRPLLMVALKLFLPLLIILLVALLGLFLPADEIEARSSIGVTALLSCFAFQFTVSGNLPDVAYLTICDGLFIVAYSVTSGALVSSIISFFLHKKGRNAASLRLDRLARVLLFAFSLGPAAFMMRPPKEPPPPPPAPMPSWKRTPSTRSSVRIGVLQLGAIPGSPGGPGLFWPLVREDRDGKRLPIYVESDASVTSDTLNFLADGELEVRWPLRPGMRFSDGHPLAPSDAQFAIDVSHDPELLGARAAAPRDLLVRFSDRLAFALDPPALWPQHALEAARAKGGYEAVREVRMKQVVPSTGPYKVASWEPEKLLVLEPNLYFPGPAPNIARVEIHKVASSAAGIAAFSRGELDLLAPNTTTPEDTRKFRAERPDAVLIRRSASFVMLAPDLNVPLLAKREVRRALVMALDRERLRREIYGEEGRVAHAPLPDVGEVEKIAHAPDEARALLAKHNAGAAELKLFHGPSAVDKQQAAAVAEAWTGAGLKIKLTEVAKPNDLFRERKHGGILLYAMRGSRDFTSRAWWNLPMQAGRHQGDARHDAYSDEVAALVDRERRALYPERRRQLQDRLFQRFSQQLPYLPLLFAAERWVVHPKLRGWDPGDKMRFGDEIERWYFEAEPLAPDTK